MSLPAPAQDALWLLAARTRTASAASPPGR
jgi:hypothetical protein